MVPSGRATEGYSSPEVPLAGAGMMCQGEESQFGKTCATCGPGRFGLKRCFAGQHQCTLGGTSHGCGHPTWPGGVDGCPSCGHPMRPGEVDGCPSMFLPPRPEQVRGIA